MDWCPQYGCDVCHFVKKFVPVLAEAEIKKWTQVVE